MRFDKGKKVSNSFGVKSVNLELVDRWRAHPLCIRYAFANPSQVAQLQESRSSAMSRLPRSHARPGAPGGLPLSTKAHKQIGDGAVLSTRELGGGNLYTYIYIYIYIEARRDIISTARAAQPKIVSTCSLPNLLHVS